jgi:hypothetical protein
MSNYKYRLLPADHCKISRGDLPRGNAGDIHEYFRRHFDKPWSLLTTGGRSAMSVIFNHLKLKQDDEIWITTTFNYPNISSCVTCTVFNYCKPSRVLSPATKAIFVIHEFGVAHPELASLRAIASERGIPLIEDCAHTFMSLDFSGSPVGTSADWVVMSFPKFYPVYSGGMVLSGDASRSPMTGLTGEDDDFQIVSGSLPLTESYAADRIKIADMLIGAIQNESLTPLLKPRDSSTVGWFFPVDTPDASVYCEAFRKKGIEAGIWHGSNVVVLPLHQYITPQEADEMAALVLSAHQDILNNGL